MPLRSGLGAVLEMQIDDASVHNFNAGQWIQVERLPVASVGAGADARVAILDLGVHEIGIPVAVFGVVRLLGVVMNPHVKVEFFDELLDQIQVRDGLLGVGGDAVEIHFFGKDKNLPPVGGVGAHDHARADGANAAFIQLGLELGDVFIRQIMVQLEVGLGGAELLIRVEFNGFVTGGGGFFNGLKRSEFVKCPGLAAHGKFADLAGVRQNWLSGRGEGQGSRKSGGQQEAMD